MTREADRTAYRAAVESERRDEADKAAYRATADAVETLRRGRLIKAEKRLKKKRDNQRRNPPHDITNP